MKPVFLRSNQHPVVSDVWGDYLDLYKFYRRSGGRTREGARKATIQVANSMAATQTKGASS